MIARAGSVSRKQTPRRPAPGRACPSRAAPARPQRRRARRSRGCRRRDRLDRAGGDEVDANAARAEVARQVARDGLERGLRHAHPVVDRPRDRGVEVQADDAPPPRLHRAAAAPRASALSENALVWNAVERALAGRSRKPPPSASSGAKAIACSTPSSPPQRVAQLRGERVEVLGLVDVELEHVGWLGQLARGALGQPSSRVRSRSARSRRPPPAPARRPRTRWSRGQHAGDKQALALEHGSSAGYSRLASACTPAPNGERRERASTRSRVSLGRDHLVDVPVGGRRARRAGARRRRRRRARARSRRVVGGLDLAPVDDLDGLRAPITPICARPGEHEVGAEVREFIAMNAPP